MLEVFASVIHKNRKKEAEIKEEGKIGRKTFLM
jgi:hypothetical protein